MPRPKGSKNKKTAVDASGIENQIAQKIDAKAALEAEQKSIEAVIAENNAKLKSVKKDIRALDKQLASLQAKKAEAEAAALVAEKQQDIQAAIQNLVAEGKSLDDILSMLK